MKRYLLFVVLVLISITGFSQTYNSLPAGFVAYTTGTYKNPAGVVIMGTAAGKFRVITQQQVLDSLLALKVTLNPISPQSGNISLDNNSALTIAKIGGGNAALLHGGGGLQLNNGPSGSATVQAGGIIQVASSSGATSITPGGNIWGGDSLGNNININSNVVNIKNTAGEGITATKYAYSIYKDGNAFHLRPNPSPNTNVINLKLPKDTGTLARLEDIDSASNGYVKLSPTSSQAGNISITGALYSNTGANQSILSPTTLSINTPTGGGSIQPIGINFGSTTGAFGLSPIGVFNNSADGSSNFNASSSGINWNNNLTGGNFTVSSTYLSGLTPTSDFYTITPSQILLVDNVNGSNTSLSGGSLSVFIDGGTNSYNLDSRFLQLKRGNTTRKITFSNDTTGNDITNYFPDKSGKLARLDDFTSGESRSIDIEGNIKGSSFTVNGVGNYGATNGIYSAALEAGGLSVVNSGIPGYAAFGRDRISNVGATYAKYISFGDATGSNKDISFPDENGTLATREWSSTNAIQNQNSTAQTGDSWITGGYKAGAYNMLRNDGLYINSVANNGGAYVGDGIVQVGNNDDGQKFGFFLGNRLAMRNAGSSYATYINVTSPTGGSRDITFPDASGTVALTTDLGDYVSKSGTTMTGDLLLSSATPSNALSAVPKSYVDNAITGITWKNAVRVATLVNIALSGTGTIDGVALAVGNRVLVKNQTTSADNGIYIVAAGAWTRATDADSSDEINTATVAVTSGTSQKNTQWTTTSTITTVGTDPITFGQISGAGTYTNGTNMALTGNVFSTSLTPTFTTVNATTFTGTLSGNATTATTTAAVSGTTNQVPKFTSSTNIGNSSIFDNGSAVGLSTGSPTSTAGGLDISSGGLSLIIGGDSGGSSRTNNTQKLGRIGAFHYINSEEPLAILHANSNTSNSTVSFGGGTALMNAATELAFFTANNTTTTAGSQRMIIDGAGSIGIGQGTASGVRTVINTGNDGYTGLTVKGFSPTQSANLQQWETSTGSVLASINPSGVIRSTGGFANLTTINNSLLLAGTNGLVASRNIADGNLAFIVNNQLGTAGIQAWQQGGVQVAQIFSDGSLRTPYVANTTTANNSKIETNTTGTLVSRNIADANPAFIANSTLGVSDIARFQQGGVTVAKIPLNGTVTASTDLTTKSYNDATYAPIYLSTTATLDFPNVLMEQNEVLTTTVTGAAVGDVVTLGLPDNILSTMTTYNGTFQAWVSAANTVSIRFQNNDSMNAHDLASGSFKIKVLK